MYKKLFGVCAILWVCVSSILSQGTRDKHGVYHPTQEEIANNKRLAEMWRRPAFVTLRLASMRRDFPSEEPSTTPSPYKFYQWMHFQLFITQNSGETLVIANYGGPHYQYRPELIRDGDLVPYTKDAQEKVAQAERDLAPRYGSVSSVELRSGQESRGQLVSLEAWYGTPLKPGRYQLTVRKRFAWDGDWVESNPVTFDVVPRTASTPIPDGVSVRLVPKNAKGENKGQPYRMAAEDYFAVEIVNNSDQAVKIPVIDRFYGHRLQLVKDGKLISYLAEATRLIESKDSDPRLVELGDWIVPPKTTSQLDGVSLKQWYGPLTPGIYRLTDRRRFEIGGPWTRDSAELVFEIVP